MLSNIYIRNIIKITFVIIVFYVIKESVFTNQNFKLIDKVQGNWSLKSVFLILVVFALQFINWIIEALKFRYIISKKHKIGFTKAIKAVYAGNSTGLFTPDRLGNFIGRCIIINKTSKKIVTISTMLGNFSQFITTVFYAFVSLFIITILDLKIYIPNINNYIIILIVFLILVILLFLFYYPNIIIKNINKVKFIKKYENTYGFLNEFNKNERTTIILMSLFRYSIFIMQFYLLLIAFNFNISLLETLCFSGLLYLFTTLIPSPFMGNLGTRELISVLLLKNYDNPDIVLFVSILIWIINIIIPSILGSFVLISYKKNR